MFNPPLPPLESQPGRTGTAPGAAEVERFRNVFDSLGTDKGQHGYGVVYATIPEDIGSVLELGVSVASLQAWMELFPLADVYAVDRADISIPFGVTFHQCDIDEFEPDRQFDLIVDDCTHQLDQQLRTFKRLWPHCTGWYVIEDIHHRFCRDIVKMTGGRHVCTGPGIHDNVVIVSRNG